MSPDDSLTWLVALDSCNILEKLMHWDSELGRPGKLILSATLGEWVSSIEFIESKFLSKVVPFSDI